METLETQLGPGEDLDGGWREGSGISGKESRKIKVDRVGCARVGRSQDSALHIVELGSGWFRG